MLRKLRLTPRVALAASLLYVLLWQGAVRLAGWHDVNVFGLVGLYLIGLTWLFWLIERSAQIIEQREQKGRTAADVLTGRRPAWMPMYWNPINPEAWYYGRHSQRLRQTLAMLLLYSTVFIGLYFVQFPVMAKGDGIDPFELPGGGGSDAPAGAPMQVQIKKVIRKKIVINPYSAMVFNVPTIDVVDLKIKDITKNDYQAGQIGFGGEGGGDGTGSGGFGSGSGGGGGFGMGTGKGRLRFFRLKHSTHADANNWSKNFGLAGDQNMWNKFKSWTRLPESKVSEAPEAVDFSQLAAFPDKSAPPFLFVSGQMFRLDPQQKRTLKQYLLDRHGMLFAEDMRGLKSEFFAVMNEVTGVEGVVIPRDEAIHRRPFPVPELPILVAHGGKAAYGWKVDGRWVAYYHPGAISDLWKDDHSGAKTDVWEESYRLGINVMAYSYLEYNRWLSSQKQP